MALAFVAEAGEVLVSGAVPPLVSGSGLGFEPRGTHELKGVPEPWPLLAAAFSPSVEFVVLWTKKSTLGVVSAQSRVPATACQAKRNWTGRRATSAQRGSLGWRSGSNAIQTFAG